MMVNIGIDPHKRSHTAVAIDEHDRVLDTIRVEAGPEQARQLQRWAARWPERSWAIENVNGLGWLLARQLLDLGENEVRDVPATLSAQVRRLSGGRHKTDDHDARATAIAGRHATILRPVVIDTTAEVLRLKLDRRWHVVSARQQLTCRLHDLLAKLVPGGCPRNLTATKVAVLLRSIRPTDPVGIEQRLMVKDMLAELRRLDRQRTVHDRSLHQAVDASGTSLRQIAGIRDVGAATILAIVGDVRRFPTAGHFASFTGTAPMAASSGDIVRHRLNMGGNRQLNKVLHHAASTQARMPGHPGHVYVTKKMAEGKTKKEAVRALKRHLSNVVFRTLRADIRTAMVSGEDRQVA